MPNRIESIDLLRGIAVLQMIFWQIFDFYAKVNIYSDSPYYIRIFDMPINGIGFALFTFASGASVYLSVIGKIKNKEKPFKIIIHSIKRYGGYILLSLVFTAFVFGFRTFYIWKEAVQGIGFAALIASFMILLSGSKWVYIVFGLAFAIIQPLLRKAVETGYIAQNFPLEPSTLGIFSSTISLILNSTIRGFFSLTHALPMMLFGVLLGIWIVGRNREKLMKASFLAGITMIAASIAMHLTINKIDVYLWSPAYQIGFTGISFLLFGIAEYLLMQAKIIRITNILSLFGKTAIIAYLAHFVLIYKPLKMLNLESLLGQPYSYILAIISTIFIYHLSKVWLNNKKRILIKLKGIITANFQ